MKGRRQFVFCIASALALLIVGVISSPHNPQHWVLYIFAGLITMVTLSAYKEAIPLLGSRCQSKGTKHSSEQLVGQRH